MDQKSLSEQNYVVDRVRAVLPDRLLDDARVVVRDGRIAEISSGPGGNHARHGNSIDGRGLLVLPQAVDGHSDVLMRQLSPRPGADLPPAFARTAVTGQLRAAGIGSCFHGVAFQRLSAVGLPVEEAQADVLYSTIAETWTSKRSGVAGGVDHQILHRVDVRCPQGIEALRARLAEAAGAAGPVPVVSYEDHTPGQGQYADPAVMERWLVGAAEMTTEGAADHVAQLIEDRNALLAVREEALDWLGALALAGDIVLLGHDPATIADVDELQRRGATVAEFPTTVEAAMAARDRGLHVVVGAPNIVRGGSHSGNVSATELVAAGAVDMIASDYLPSAMITAAVELARLGLASLPAAVAMITRNTARALGRPDRGALEVGQRADLVLVDDSERWPEVVATL